ncbi:MAG: PepSY domain-containing protein [Proteobacteria bacterium]|nr:PepSY domain-containing protein [Pseudomonadota bacterium]
MTVRRVHQLVGLSVAALWLLQILTGLLLTFRMEIDNTLMGGTDAPLQVESLDERIRAIQSAGSTVSSVWVTNFTATRFDVLYTDAAHHERKMRVDGAGRVLRDGPGDSRWVNGGFFATLTDIHTTLLVGPLGKWLIAGSGLLLLSNLILGLKLAWPRRGYWLKSLALRTNRNAAANFYGLHRTLGLYIAFPLLLLVSAGIALCFDDDLEEALHVVREPPAIAAAAPGVTASAAAAAGTSITPARAMTVALARFPGSTLTALGMPTPEEPWYRVKLHIPGEVSRMYGLTTVYLSTADGTVLREYSAAAASPTRLILDWMYPIHTAEAGGVVARMLLVCIGIALLTMGYLGIRLWSVRSAQRQNKFSAQRKMNPVRSGSSGSK